MRDLEKKRAYDKEHYQGNKEHYLQYYSDYAKAHRKQKNLNNIKYNRKIKLEVLTYYSVGVLQCACCSETLIEFLTIDHINGKGRQEKKRLNRVNLYGYLKTHNYPLGYRVLCLNCNFAIGHYGYCPHQVRRD